MAAILTAMTERKREREGKESIDLVRIFRAYRETKLVKRSRYVIIQQFWKKCQIPAMSERKL